MAHHVPTQQVTLTKAEFEELRWLMLLAKDMDEFLGRGQRLGRAPLLLEVKATGEAVITKELE